MSVEEELTVRSPAGQGLMGYILSQPKFFELLKVRLEDLQHSKPLGLVAIFRGNVTPSWKTETASRTLP